LKQSDNGGMASLGYKLVRASKRSEAYITPPS